MTESHPSRLSPLAAVPLAVLLAGCAAGPVTVNAPISDEADVEACAALIAALPDTLAGRERREVRPTDAPAAAWGDPAIVLTCGGAVPDDFGFAPCVEADGVGWYVPEDAGPDEPYVIATVGQDPTVVVDMPFWPPADVLLELAAPVDAHTTEVTPCD